MKTVDQVLDAAADLIEAAPKLAKGIYQAPAEALGEDGRDTFDRHNGMGSDDCYCTAGAIERVAGFGHIDTSSEAAYALGKHLGIADDVLFLFPWKPIFRWNDAPERTKDEVVQALRGAAQTVREGRSS